MVLGILDVKSFDMVFIDIQVADVVQALQHEVRGVVQEMHARVIPCGLEKAFKGDAVMQVFARVNFIGQVDTVFIRFVEQGLPAFRQFLKTQFDQARGTLRPGVHRRPQQCARKGGHDVQSQVLRCLHGFDHLRHRPLGSLLRMPVQFCGRKGVKEHIIGRVNGD